MANIQFAKETEKKYQTKRKQYKILIVDDEESIHDITKIAIKAMDFSDFELVLLHAFSAKEAKIIMQENDDIALALIDVVMETPEAGLELVNYIRKELLNKLIRLVIRTGQANNLPQMDIIQHYDINDFKEKTELTIERLYTTVRSSVLQFAQLIELQGKYKDTYKQLTTNQLTLLPNRVKLVEDFTHKSHQTLILIDIIGFSIINETNGYAVGDYVLRELAGFLVSNYSNKFKVYHLNNDLFALVTIDGNLENFIVDIEKIKDDISKFEIQTNSFNKTIETTIGVAYETENDIMRKAELALKEARMIGRNQIKFYSNDLKIIKQITNTNHWAPIIKNALENNGLLAYAQPIYDLKTNKIYKYELLVRLQVNDTIYPPIDFLTAAKNSGQLYNIFTFMFEQGCIKASQTSKKFSINISDSEFLNDNLYNFIVSTLQKYKVDTSLLSLELLENNAISNNKQIKEMIIKISQLGISFVADDFGVQCSNFGQIEFLPIDTIKIDGSFIKNIDNSLDSKIIVKTIQTFAKEKNIKLVAEFVCNEEVYNTVKELGIEYAQGYYLAMPELELK